MEGPRGSGKSTILRAIAANRRATLIDLDDESVLRLVRQDPGAALAAPGLVAVDEFHRAPDVLSVVKRVVDREGGVGRFLLAGSVSSFLLPPGTETLTGRAHRLVLPPLSIAESLGTDRRWLAELVDTGCPPSVRTDVTRSSVFDAVVAGGYPAALQRSSLSARSRWFRSYLATVTDRDLSDLIDIRRAGALARLYQSVASRTSSVLINAELGQALDLTSPTIAAYRGYLERLYLTAEIPGWTVGASAKPGRRPKVHVFDTGLAAGALGLSAERLAASPIGGAFLESFVLNELVRQATSIDEDLRFSHFRDRSGVEVDIVVERSDGQVFAFEVKAARSVDRKDGRGVMFLRSRLGDRLTAGLIFHTGPLTVQLDERVWAVPVAALWGGDAFPVSSVEGQGRRSRPTHTSE